MKLLAVGDLHLGRTPSRLPDDLVDRAREIGPAGTWQRIVDTAIHKNVDAEVLAGDVVEEEHDFFEAYRELSTGVDQLLKAEKDVIAVAGNHDVKVLPRLANQIGAFRMLGRAGKWQRVTLESGNERVTLHGWSFPQLRVSRSPLSNHRFEPGPGPNLGVLHCDRDHPSSFYAPVRSSELDAAGLDGWLLGHIHAPDELSLNHPIGYLGSATGLDPGERSAHGPWLITIEGGRITAIKQWVLAPLRWERLTVDLTDIEAAEDARDRLLNKTQELDETLLALPTPPEAVGLRVTFTGRTNMRRAVERLLVEEDLDNLYTGTGSIHYFVEGPVYYSTQPELNMASLAKRNDPPGLLGRRLEILERDYDDPEHRELIKAARRHLIDQTQKPYWQPLNIDSPNDEEISRWLQEAGMAALDRLLAQRESVK